MSSGQKAWANEIDDKAFEEHLKRVTNIRPVELVLIAERINKAITHLERKAHLPRSAWFSLDEIKDALKKIL